MKLKGWSYSAVGSLLDGCGWQFALERFLRQRADYDHPRAAVGTAYHAAIEAHEEARRLWHYSGGRVGCAEGVPREDMYVIAEASLKASSVQWMIHDWSATVQEAYAAVAHWWDAPIPKEQPGGGGTLRERVMAWRPVAIEARFQLWTPASARRVRGAADGVYLTPEGDIVIVDAKQARHFRNYPHDGSKNRLQAAVYSWAAVEAPNLPARRRDGWPAVEFHISRVERGSNANHQGVRVVRVEPDNSDVALLLQRVANADAQVADADFPKRPDWFLCKGEWCAFHPDSSDPAFAGTCDPDAPPEFPVDVVGEPLPVLR